MERDRVFWIRTSDQLRDSPTADIVMHSESIHRSPLAFVVRFGALQIISTMSRHLSFLKQLSVAHRLKYKVATNLLAESDKPDSER